MIEDLKADSARWDQERRQQSSRHSAGGTIASRDSNSILVRQSNTFAVQYRNSETHSSRQYYGPSQTETAYGDNRDAYGDGPRYPGTGNGGYSGASGNAYPAQQYGSQGAFAQPGFSAGQPQQFTQATGSYPGHSPMNQTGFSQPPGQDQPYMVGAHSMARGERPPEQPLYANDGYAAVSRDPRDIRSGDPRVPASSMPASRTVYATSGSVPQAGYPGSNPTSAYYPQSSGAPASPYAQTQPPARVQPQDPFYGRGA
jgi:hypothetical protein